MIIKCSNFFLFLLQRVLYHSDPSCLQPELSNGFPLLNKIPSEQPDFGLRLQMPLFQRNLQNGGLSSECVLGTSWQVFFLKHEYYVSQKVHYYYYKLQLQGKMTVVLKWSLTVCIAGTSHLCYGTTVCILMFKHTAKIIKNNYN